MLGQTFHRLCYKVKDKVFYCQEPHSGESTTTECVVNYQLLAVMLLKLSNGELPVVVDHSQIRTMASRTEDAIDWPLPPTIHRAVLSELHVLHGGNAGYKSQDLLQPLRSKHPTLGLPGQRTVCAATQGIDGLFFNSL